MSGKGPRAAGGMQGLTSDQMPEAPSVTRGGENHKHKWVSKYGTDQKICQWCDIPKEDAE